MDRAYRSVFALITGLALLFIPIPASAGDQAPEPKRLGPARKQYPHNALHRTSIAFSPDGKKLAWVHHQFEGSSPTDGGLAIVLWDFDKGYQTHEMVSEKPKTYARSTISFTPNSRMIVAGCFQAIPTFTDKGDPQTEYRNNVHVWLVASGKELPLVPREAGLNVEFCEAVLASPDGKTIHAAYPKGGRAWKIPDGEEARQFEHAQANKLVFSPDCTLLAGTLVDGTVVVFKTADGKETVKLPGTGRPLEFSPDGKHLATWHEDKVALWSLDGGKQVWSLPCQAPKDDAWGPHFAYAPDGKRVAWNDGKAISVVDAATGKVVMTLTAENGPLAFSSDSQRLALACADGSALVWSFGLKK